ncbi:hypothetical protein PSA01_57670 [Pseudonocardia saturnea]|uniref:Uncharacterized protein n=1 Tax=Pseudonocardia saturnea TaxID=33909 RepID=A0ABQ0S7F6_9PSEU|nr:hypothetical protein Pdca_14540 [Pseudonocardia autotrophica]GEC28738.1 hypothetical protein PSA01_57670 [Pseudonocardia saturnea]
MSATATSLRGRATSCPTTITRLPDPSAAPWRTLDRGRGAAAHRAHPLPDEWMRMRRERIDDDGRRPRAVGVT